MSLSQQPSTGTISSSSVPGAAALEMQIPAKAVATESAGAAARRQSPVFSDERFAAAVKFIEQSRFVEAKGLFEALASAYPASPEVFYNLGVLHIKHLKDDLAAAAACLETALRLRPTFPQCRLAYASMCVDLGADLNARGDPAAAAAMFEKATVLDRRNCLGWYNMGVLVSAGASGAPAVAKAAQCFEIATDANPAFVPGMFMLGLSYNALGRPEEAIACWEKALALDPGHRDSRSCLATVMYETGNFHRTLKVLAPIADDGKDPVVQNVLGMVERERGNPAASQSIMRALRLANRAIFSNFLFLQNYNPDASLLSMRESYEEYEAVAAAAVKDVSARLGLPERRARTLAAWHAAATSPTSPSDRPSRLPLVRVGFVSSDFREHSVSYFIEPFLRGYDRTDFEVFLYSVDAHSDARTELFRRLVGGDSHFRSFPVHADTTEAIARAVADDGVHILVDLAGHTGNNSLYAFAAKPAPVQVSYIGYPNTTGLRAVDYRIVDSSLWPAESEQYSAERLVNLPGCFTCYTPPEQTADAALEPEARPLADRARREVVSLGTFTGVAKINDRVLRVWARIAAALGARAEWVLKSKLFTSKNEQLRFERRLAAAGFDVSRVRLVEQTPTTASHLQAYELLDISLDTFPYSGTTTTCEAMWQGVPVVTLRGDRQSHNASASLLNALGIPENVARTEDEYVARAIELATDPAKLRAASGAPLRERMRRSVLCDSGYHVANLSKAFFAMLTEQGTALADAAGTPASR